MNDKPFLDTNVLIYALARHDPREERARELLAQGGVISVQVLNEFASVARRKLKMSWRELNDALDAIETLCPDPVPLTIDTHHDALKIAEKQRCGIYDALIAAAALQVECTTLYSEDFQDGQTIREQLTIRNPFR